MALVALLAIPPAVNIILFVAGKTRAGNLHSFAHRITMTRLTLQSFMSAPELVICLSAMIKLPQTPPIRIVTAGAIRSQRSLMTIILIMTGKTSQVGILKRRRQMTFPAGRNSMNPNEREDR
jgi:hypothetical protein